MRWMCVMGPGGRRTGQALPDLRKVEFVLCTVQALILFVLSVRVVLVSCPEHVDSMTEEEKAEYHSVTDRRATLNTTNQSEFSVFSVQMQLE